MSNIGTPRAVADLPAGLCVATVELAAPPQRVFDALASDEVCRWWVRPGVFDTREWSGDVRPGGSWHAAGIGGGRPYGLEGEFVEVERPNRLVHTWKLSGTPEAATTIEYVLEATDSGTRVTLRQAKFANRGTCAATALGWETSFEELARMLGS